MDQATQVMAFIGAIISCMLLAFGLYFISKGSFSKARIESLRGDLAEARETATDLRGRVGDLEHKEEIQHLEIERLKSENELLTGLVTQRAQVDQTIEIGKRLETTLNSHHEQAMEAWNDLGKEMANLATAVGKLIRPIK